MSLDWSNERYVRLYARLTPDMAAWAWQAKAVWPWVLVCADGAGIIETAKGARGVAAVLAGGGFPLDVVEAGLVELVADGCLEARPDGRGYVVRNYVEAQTATMSDSARKARQRDRERAERARCGAQDAGTSPADHGHAPSRQVTPGHAESRGDRSVTPDVTPSRAEPKDLSPTVCAGARDPSAPVPVPAQDAGKPVGQRPDSPGALVMAAADRLTAARRAIDPAALPVTEANAREVLARLAEAGQDARKRLDHALACVEARARSTRTVDALGWSSFASEKAWAWIQQSSVEGYAAGATGRSHSGQRDGPRRQPPTPQPPRPTLKAL